ncbi:porin family protein [Croceitalea rosinachiae]|uniref:Porin family protein n=1 Tax=Croceitalea rosinachiae TaxID=3075596 RepID=A0ABU3A6C0_9FLAO|nr:porin family protein [Croceitalea sp. F388]MDT0605727.1 porin family protein [Croceitalea sp. F388]
MQKRNGILLFMVCSSLLVTNLIHGQDSIAVSTTIDAKYLEDQFYAGIAYNFLTDLPEDGIQRNLSYNIGFGFIRDIPMNRSRNFGFGLGVGYATNSYYSNIIAEESLNDIVYQFSVSSDVLRRSKFETHGITFPFEIRWRTSNAVDYNFWRIYTGIKAEYLFSRRSISRFEGDRDDLNFSNNDISEWQYGLTLNFGYNTWNIHLYYSLNPLLENSALLNGERIRIRPLRVGVIFYIL